MDGTESRHQPPEPVTAGSDDGLVPTDNTQKAQYDKDIKEFIKKDGIAKNLSLQQLVGNPLCTSEIVHVSMYLHVTTRMFQYPI